MPVTAERGGIYLQLGAFSVRSNAESFEARIGSQLAPLGMQPYIEQRGPLHRVLLGPFKDRAAAGAAAERIRTLLEVKPVVVVR
jgi:rare lipoprotein A